MPAVKGILPNLRALTGVECAARDYEVNNHSGGVGLVVIEKSNNRLWLYVACNDLPDRLCVICNSGNNMAVELCKNYSRHNVKRSLFYRCIAFIAGVQCLGNFYPMYAEVNAINEMNGPNLPEYLSISIRDIDMKAVVLDIRNS